MSAALTKELFKKCMKKNNTMSTNKQYPTGISSAPQKRRDLKHFWVKK
jgi:hypothetical protein